MAQTDKELAEALKTEFANIDTVTNDISDSLGNVKTEVEQLIAVIQNPDSISQEDKDALIASATGTTSKLNTFSETLKSLASEIPQ